jgi:hypothetical protein
MSPGQWEKLAEALRLAGMLQAQADRHIAFIDDFRYQAAIELRRQHAEIERLTAENERLRGLLTEAREDVECLGPGLLLDRIDAALRREDV